MLETERVNYEMKCSASQFGSLTDYFEQDGL